MVKTVKTKLKPNFSQEKLLFKFSDARRYIYNKCLELDNKHYSETKHAYTHFELNRIITSLKQDDIWLCEVSIAVLQLAAKDYVDARNKWIKYISKKIKNASRIGKPKFRSKKRTFPNFKIFNPIRINNNKIKLPRLGYLKCGGNNLSKIKEEDILFVAIKLDQVGDWWASIVYEKEEENFSVIDSQVGMDLGLKDLITLSTGEKIEAPRIFRKHERKLVRAQRKLSRRKSGSKRRVMARKEVAKIHRKIARIRNNFQHQLSARLTDQYSLICIEDLNLKGLMRTKLAKSFMDAGLGEFVRQLEYKAKWKGKYIQKVDRFFPSSKMCSKCGQKNVKLELRDRVWTCQSCGTQHDRDHNASINIKVEGIKNFRKVAMNYIDTINGRGVRVGPTSLAFNSEASITPKGSE